MSQLDAILILFQPNFSVVKRQSIYTRDERGVRKKGVKIGVKKIKWYAKKSHKYSDIIYSYTIYT